MPEILIRPATLEDAEFLVSGNASMALETETRALDTHTLRAGVCALFDHPARGFYLIAEIDGQPAGQMMITFEWSDWRNGAFWWIQSVYTLPESRGRGVFKALYSHVESLARESAGVCGLRLYVEAHNQRAHAAYLRCGMSEAI
jgi:GNAT superfamily N-acetyltransferase